MSQSSSNVHLAPAELAGSPPPGSAHTPIWEILSDCSAGAGEDGWRELVRRVGPRLSRTLTKLLTRRGEAVDSAQVEDLCQEVYCRLIAGWRRPGRRFRGASEAEATAYLHRIAVRVVLDVHRAARSARRGAGVPTLRLLPALADGLAAPTVDSPEHRLLARDRRRRFRANCRELLGGRASERTLRVAELALYAGLSSREIALRLGPEIGISGINSIFHRLRRGLAARGRRAPRRSRRVE